MEKHKMKTKFQDYYGRHITVHNETASGAICIEVRQTPNLNDVRFTKEDGCSVEQEIKLNKMQLQIMISSLSMCLED